MKPGNVLPAGILLAVVWAGGCRSAPQDDVFAKAEYLVLNQQFDEAVPLLKQFLSRNPEHSGAHYYLGRCYFAPKKSFWLTIAEGEITTALNIFLRDGRRNTISRFSNEYFELICHLDIAKIHLKQAVFLIDKGAPAEDSQSILDKARQQIEEARRVIPDSPDIAQMEKGVNDIQNAIRRIPPVRQYPRPMPVPHPSGRIV